MFGCFWPFCWSYSLVEAWAHQKTWATQSPSQQQDLGLGQVSPYLSRYVTDLDVSHCSFFHFVAFCSLCMVALLCHFNFHLLYWVFREGPKIFYRAVCKRRAEIYWVKFVFEARKQKNGLEGLGNGAKPLALSWEQLPSLYLIVVYFKRILQAPWRFTRVRWGLDPVPFAYFEAET